MGLRKYWAIAILIILFSIPAAWQIVTTGYFPMHDNVQIARVAQMTKALSAGQFPVRWAPDLGFGYGYPIFNFYNPLPYYFAAFFHLLGINILTSTKIMFAFPVFASGLAMYLFSKSYLKTLPAFISAILYVYAPYHGVQIYVRGAVAEYWAYAILPLLFWAIWNRKNIWSVFSLSALILSHNITTFISVPFILLLITAKYLSLDKNRLSFIINCSLAIAFSLALSAFFWLPAVIQSQLTLVDQMVYSEFDPPSSHIIQPAQIWSSNWGYGGSSAGVNDGLSLQLGKIHLVGGLLAILIISSVTYRKILRGGSLDYRFYFWFITISIGFLLSLFMILPASIPIWNYLKILSYVQFPWRFLMFASFFSSILTAYCIHVLVKNIRIKILRPTLIIIFCILFIAYSFKFFEPQYKFPIDVSQLVTHDTLVWDSSSLSYEYLPKGFEKPRNREEALRIDNPLNQALITSFKQNTQPLQLISNIISLTALLALSFYHLYAKPRKYRRTTE